MPDEDWVDLINEQVCRFAYEAVIAQSAGHEAMNAKYADVSPVHEAVPLQVGKGLVSIHWRVFGPRVAKSKWKTE